MLKGKAMDKEIIFLVEESAEGGYTAKALDYDIFTEADSLEDLKVMAQDAVRCYFNEAEKPPIIRKSFSDVPILGRVSFGRV